MTLRCYISAADSNEILVFDFDGNNGVLKPLQTLSLTELTGNPVRKRALESVPLAVSPDKKFLYAATRFEPFTVSSFAIGKDGLLSYLATGPIAHTMAYIATDRTGRFLIGASYPGSLLSVNSIGADGIVATKPNQIVPFRQNAHCIMPSPDNRFIYSAVLGEDAMVWCPFDSERGRILDQEGGRAKLPPGLGPRHFVFHPNGRFFYLNTEQGGTVHAYRRDTATGRLTEIQSISAMPPDFCATASTCDFHITPDGRFLYMSDRTFDVLVGFAVDESTGKLSPIGRFPTEKRPRSFAIDPQGKFMISTGQDGHHAAVSAIDAQGQLKDVFRIPAGRTPAWVEILDI